MSIKIDAPFASLIDERQVGQVTKAFEDIIMQSFGVDAARRANEGRLVQPALTRQSVKDRFDILAKWFKVMRGDLSWSLQRVLDTLPRALRAELDGEEFVPDNRATWATSTTTHGGET